MDKMKYIPYCGLYCKLCVNFARIPQQASALKNTMSRAGYEFFGDQIISKFREFWAALGKLSNPERCPACRGGCGNPDCKIRICAQKKKMDLCSSCPDYPCEHINELAKHYPILISDGMRQKQIGLDAWIKEQEERLAMGFCYEQIRYSP
jgi:hypothetical protein